MAGGSWMHRIVTSAAARRVGGLARQMSGSAAAAPVLFSEPTPTGRLITLNREKALNSLNLEMVLAMVLAAALTLKYLPHHPIAPRRCG